MAIATLTGCVISTLFGAADHTYVRSEKGHTWECFGSGSGGSDLCSGDGDLDFADCLSYSRFTLPNGVVIPGLSRYADMAYLTQGLCHQASNRILCAAGLTVAGAGGFDWSIWVYSAYGSEGVPGPD
jgi:hypothetical protein